MILPIIVEQNTNRPNDNKIRKIVSTQFFLLFFFYHVF